MEYTNSSLVTYTNLTKNRSTGRAGKNLERLTPHVFVGQVTAKRGVDYFMTSNQSSCTYVIGKDGDIGQSVDEKNRPWTSSNADNDNKAITFEIASDTVDPYKITDKAWNSLVELCVDICKRYNKKRLIWIPNKTQALAYKVKEDELLLTVHRWFANKACPGDYIYNRLGELADTVTKRLNTTVSNKTPLTVEQAWAVENGLFAGYGNGEFGWGDNLTRGQAAILLKRFYDLMNKKAG